MIKIRAFLVLVFTFTFSSISMGQEYSSEDVWGYINSRGGIQNTIKDIANRASKGLPQKMDSETEAYSVTALSGEVHFNMRLFNRSKSQVEIGKLKEILIEKNSKFLCSSPISRVLIKEADVKYSYSFYSKDMEYLFKYTVDKRYC